MVLLPKFEFLKMHSKESNEFSIFQFLKSAISCVRNQHDVLVPGRHW